MYLALPFLMVRGRQWVDAADTSGHYRRSAAAHSE